MLVLIAIATAHPADRRWLGTRGDEREPGEFGCDRYAAPLSADCARAVWKTAAVATARELLLGRSWAS